jgi:hypothetical protein
MTTAASPDGDVSKFVPASQQWAGGGAAIGLDIDGPPG